MGSAQYDFAKIKNAYPGSHSARGLAWRLSLPGNEACQGLAFGSGRVGGGIGGRLLANRCLRRAAVYLGHSRRMCSTGLKMHGHQTRAWRPWPVFVRNSELAFIHTVGILTI